MAKEPTTVKGVLKKARKLIEDKSNWTRNTFARNAKGTPVDWNSPEAVKFCARGALLRAAPNYALRDAAEKLLVQEAGIAGRGIVNANDTPKKQGGLGHDGILEAFDRTIKKA